MSLAGPMSALMALPWEAIFTPLVEDLHLPDAPQDSTLVCTVLPVLFDSSM